MSEPTLPETPDAIVGAMVDTLHRRGITEFALTGAIALGVWARPRSTNDIDVCAVIPESAVDALLALHDGMRVGPERVPAIIRIRLMGWDVDLFAAKTEYDRACLDRADLVNLAGVQVKVVSAEDLIIHKLRKLKDDKRKLLQDAADLQAIAEARGEAIDREWLQRWLPPEDAAVALKLATLGPEQLVAWLAAR